MSHRPPSSLPGRRSVLRGSLAASGALALPAALGSAPAFALSGRPKAGWGVQAGDVTADSGLVWVRSDRRARMIVETSATESFRNPRRWHGPLLGTDTDFTGTTRLRGLPSGEQIHYRVLLADPDDPRRTGEPVTGTFRTTPHGRRGGVRFLWSGDLAGQGWGINPDIGGYRIYDAMGGSTRTSSCAAATTSTRTARSPRPPRSPTAAHGGTSRPRRSPRSPSRWRSSAETSATTCSTRTSSGSTPRCPPSSSGTTTRCATTGTRAR